MGIMVKKYLSVNDANLVGSMDIRGNIMIFEYENEHEEYINLDILNNGVNVVICETDSEGVEKALEMAKAILKEIGEEK
jgi:hypothetical protein